MEQLGVNRKHRHSHGCASPGTVTEAREGTDPALSAEKTFSADSAGQMSRMLAKKNDKAPDTPEQLVASGRDHGLPVPYSVARKHKCSKNVPRGRAASPHLHNQFFSNMSTACHGPAYLSSMVWFSARFVAGGRGDFNDHRSSSSTLLLFGLGAHRKDYLLKLSAVR